ncbi:hypothetical protein M0802_002165 [Mischocyttarus mexicanus]|nr:hypothetical protein M0802_002165 [Mischocyttarus mexicanus]
MNRQSKSNLEEIAASIEERHCDLTGRHRYLREKITTMERSIPAIMAYNMWISGKNCDDAPFCKIRQIMNKMSPDLDPTEKLLRNLRNTVKDLNKETTELHDKIIDADIKLEETEIELESIELENKEMNNQVDEIEKEIRSYKSTSLHSIHSEDLICLTKIHQLAKDELELKNCITVLEEKEALYAEQLDRLLASKEYQNISGNNKMLKRIQDLECNERRMHCALQFYKNNVQRLKKELVRKKSDSSINSTTPQTTHNQIARDKSPKKNEINENNEDKKTASSNKFKAQRTEIPNEQTGIKKKIKEEKLVSVNDENQESKKACICPKKKTYEIDSTKNKSAKSLKNAQIIPSNVCPFKSNNDEFLQQYNERIKKDKCKILSNSKHLHGSMAVKNPCSINLPCDLPPCAILKSKCPTTPCNYKVMSNNSYDMSSSCKKCNLIRKKNECRCNCKGKCAFGLSGVPCRCGVVPSCPFDKGYQPIAKSLSHLCINSSDSSDDDEYCECCSCGCENTDDNNSSCCCN